MAVPLMAVGLGISAFQLWSGLQQSHMIREQAGLQSRINSLNARYAELDAYEAEKYGFTQASRYQSVIDATVGSQRAAYASQGVDVSFGTAAAVQAESQLAGFLNKLDMQKEARQRALGLKVEASNIRLGGAMQRSQAEIQAFGAMAGGVTSAASTAFYSAAESGFFKAKPETEKPFSVYVGT